MEKITDHAKYIATSELNKLAGSIFDTKLKQAHLATNSDFNVISQRANKNKKKKQKNAKVWFELLSRWKFFGDDGFQKIFVVQPTFSTISLK